jgi:hypothetical protein
MKEWLDQRSKTKEIKIKGNNEKGKKGITRGEYRIKAVPPGNWKDGKKREERQNRGKGKEKESIRVFGPFVF